MLAQRAKLVVPEDNGPDDLDSKWNQVLVAQGPSTFKVQLYSLQQLPAAASRWQGVTLSRDGRTLQVGLDYDVRYNPEEQTLAIESAAGVFEDGVYRVSFPRELSANSAPPTEFVVFVRSLLPTPQHVKFQNGPGRYSSAKYELYGPIELVPRGADWRYLDDGSDQGMAWQELEFDDSGWNTGSAQLGYGDGDETTLISFGEDEDDKYVTSYFRHTFQVADPAVIPLLRLQLLRDDGAAVYLNGKKIVRDNLPDDASYKTFASRLVSGDSESVYHSHIVNPGTLPEGDNCLAVEVHQSARDSSDMSFDLQLGAPPVAVVAFDNLFGEGPRRIPHNACVLGATLRFILSEQSQTSLLMSQITNWERGDVDDISRTSDVEGMVSFNVVSDVQAWCDGELNLGWCLRPADESSSLDDVEPTPELTVRYIAPGDLPPLAWHFANCSAADLRDTKLALEYAQRAVKSSPEDIDGRAALGAALYRNGRLDEAITTLENVLEQGARNQRASTILAMAYAERGRHEGARQILAHLPDKSESVDRLDGELSRLRAEVERLLKSVGPGARDRNTQSADK